jgi:N-acetylglutamate synthase-like GNAT family acetyltransferase
MKANDFSFAVRIANTMNWDMTQEDFKFMVKLESQGCFVLFQDQERLGIATNISFGKVGWFGNLVVKEESRRKGAGRLLLQHSIEYLKKKNVSTIGLFAYPHLVKFYESFGFEPDIEFLVVKGKTTLQTNQGTKKKANKVDIPKILDFDNQCFGVNRKKLLKPILCSKNNLCFISSSNSDFTGYIMAKVQDKTAEVGPLLCRANRSKEAVMLLKSVLANIAGFEVLMYLPKRDVALLNVLYKAGLKADFRVVRMFLGTPIASSCLYTAESLERG